MTQTAVDPNHGPLARPFADAVAAYALAGWGCILPVPPETKTPPPSGFTGAEGRDTETHDLVGFIGEHGPTCHERCDRHGRAAYSIALRMPADVIGIDVDEYTKGASAKHGAQTMAEHVERWGPLPATWTSTARGDGPSRISFYRVPPQRYATRLVGQSTGDVEIIQRHHRYAVVAPSHHAGAGARYEWYSPAGALSPIPPSPGQLAELPAAWVAGLAEGAAGTSARPSDRASGEALLEQLSDDWRPECAEVTSARLLAVDVLERAELGSRHDVMTAWVHHLVQLAATGHTGIARALAEVRHLWETLTADEDRGEELDRALLTTARKAVTDVGAVQVPRDPCLLVGAASYAAPAPGNDAPTPRRRRGRARHRRPHRGRPGRRADRAGALVARAGVHRHPRLRPQRRPRPAAGASGSSTPLATEGKLTPAQVGSLIPALAAQDDPQVVYASSHGKADATVLADLCERGRAGNSARLGYDEWRADREPCRDEAGAEVDDCQHPKDAVTRGLDCALDREHLRRQANPTVTTGRITMETLDGLRQALPPAEFARECMGWEESADSGAAATLGVGRWEACAVEAPETPPTPSAIGVAVSVDRMWASIAAGTVTEELVDPETGEETETVYVGASDRREDPTSWLVAEVKRIQDKYDCLVVIDAKGPAADFLEAFDDADVAIETITLDQCAEACARFFNRVRTATLQHPSSEELDDAVAGAE